MKIITCEQVSNGHPDKICDQIADAIVTDVLQHDKEARVAIECLIKDEAIIIAGEMTSSYSPAYGRLVMSVIERIGWDKVNYGKDEDNKPRIILLVNQQSPDIAMGVDKGGAGDQGIMIGYACDETPELLPLEVILSRRLNQYIYDKHPYDGKTQVTIAPDGTIDSIVASFQNVPHDELEQLVQDFIKAEKLTGKLELHINPAGDWNQGGFDADTGLTGRKLIVDNYGPRVAIGGGCYSRKDPSKVDRSAAYAARRIAVDYLRKRNAREVLVRLAYAIGHDQPLEKTVIIDGEPEEIEGYDLTPNGIIKFLNLKRPIYEETARWGHYGNGFDWDK